MYDIEYIRHWPQWMACYSYPATGSLLNQFYIQGGIADYADVHNEIAAWRARYGFYTQPRNEWVAAVFEAIQGQVSITFHTSSTSGTATRVFDEYEFDHTLDPCFLVGPGVIRLRNLDMVSLSTIPASDYSVIIEEIVPDSPVWYLSSRYWERTTSPVEILASHEITVKYHSLSLFTEMATGVIRVNGGPDIALTRVDHHNWWDDIAYLTSLRRFDDEDNINLAGRASYRNRVGKAGGAAAARNNIAVDSDTVSMLTWATSGALDIVANGISDAIAIIVERTPQYLTVRERPTSMGYNTYRLSGIPDNSLLYILSNTLTIPASAEGNLVTTYQSANNVEALYRVKTYDLAYSGRFITTVTPVSGNLSEDVVRVYVIRGVFTHTIDCSAYGTAELLHIAEFIRTAAPVTLGYGAWNRLTWLTEEDDTPQMAFILEDLE